MNFTNSEKLDMLDDYLKNGSSAAHEYAQRYLKRRPPNRKYLKKIIENLRRTGSFDKKRERVKTVVNEEVETDIITFFMLTRNLLCVNQKGYAEYLAFQFPVNSKNTKFHPYKFTLVQALLPGDDQRRIELCSWTAEMSVNDASFLSHIIWTD